MSFVGDKGREISTGKLRKSEQERADKMSAKKIFSKESPVIESTHGSQGESNHGGR